MSLTSMLIVVACISAYKLGAYNQQHPGQIMAFANFVWKWMRT